MVRCSVAGVRAGPLGERSFRLLFVGQGVVSIGDDVAPIALSFAVLGLTGSVRDLSLCAEQEARWLRSLFSHSFRGRGDRV